MAEACPPNWHPHTAALLLGYTDSIPYLKGHSLKACSRRRRAVPGPGVGNSNTASPRGHVWGPGPTLAFQCASSKSAGLVAEQLGFEPVLGPRVQTP